LKFAPAECRFDNVRGIHRSFSRSCAHDGVKLVNEENDILGTPNLVHDRFDAFLELAAIFRSGNHQCQIERNHPLVPE
jgi:hypothetical protein